MARYLRVRHAAVLIPVCAFAIFDSAFSAFSAVIGEIGKRFPDVSVTTIQMLLSVPSLVAIPTILLAGVLASRFHKRTIGLAALAILFVAGLVPILCRGSDLGILFASSILVGIGQGLLNPLASSIVFDVWPSGEEQRKILGFKQASNCLGASAAALVVGYLSLAGWYHAYYVYVLTVPVFIFTWFYMPVGDVEPRLAYRGNGVVGDVVHAPKMRYLVVIFVLSCIFMFSYHTNVALVVSDNGLGSPADISLITSLNYLTAFLLGVMYGKISDALGEHTLMTGFIVMAIGLATMSFADRYSTLVIGGLVFGIGSGLQEITTIYLAGREAGHHTTMAMSFALMSVHLGVTLSPIVINTIKYLLGLNSAASAMRIGAAGFSVLAAVELFRCRSFSKRREHPAMP